MRSRSWPTPTFDAAVRPQAKRCGLEDVAHAMVHCQRMGEVDLGVNKDECCGKPDQKRGTDLENKRGGRSRQLLSSHGHDGIPNGSSKTKKTSRTSSPREPYGSALLAANKFVTDSHPCARTQSLLAVTKAVPHSSALMLAARIALAQRSDSTLMTAANSSGVFATGTKPIASRRSFTSGNATLRTISRSSRSMISFGVPAGTSTPSKVSASWPGNPASAIVGTSGSAEERSALKTASPRRLPSLVCGTAGARTAKTNRVGPPSGHGIACAG